MTKSTAEPQTSQQWHLHAALVAVLLCLTTSTVIAAQNAERPNVVIVFADDLGYGDLGCFGATEWSTLHIDSLARDGLKLTSFYVAQAVCSASRTALLTGCYPNRIGIAGALGPQAKHGIHNDEWTIAEVLKPRGYATAIFGKWHLGHHPQFAPVSHGFDEYFGLPYSNDMWPRHPTAKFPELPLMEADRVIAHNPDQTQLTKWYTQRAVQFIEKNADQPFFLYVPHTMPHVPLFGTSGFAGRSQRGLYGDVLEEIDWSVGEILAALKRTGVDKNTLVVFTSDNGPWLTYGNHAGTAGPLREGKGTAWEGGVRVPCVMRFPGRITPGSVTSEMAATVDLLPTIAALTGAELPSRKIDGLSLWPWLTKADQSPSPRQSYWFYWNQELHAVRQGPWKLHLPHPYRTVITPGQEGRPGQMTEKTVELSLFNLQDDVEEQRNVAADRSEIVAALQTIAAAARDDLGDSLQMRKPTNVRPAGMLAP